MPAAMGRGHARPILHPAAVSSFSHWYRRHVPSDRGHTDIDGLWLRGRRLEGLVEHRTGGRVGSPADNRSLTAIGRLAWHLGLSGPEPITACWRDGMVDTRFAVWLDYLTRPAPLLLAVYETPGNLSPTTGLPVVVSCEAMVVLAAHCAQFEIPWRSIEVRPDSGAPVRREDIAWLLGLPGGVRGVRPRP